MEKNIDNWLTRLGILAVVLALYLACWFGIPHLIDLDKDGSWSTRGQFGDMFGTVNALFSGLAFAGIIYTILLQREELKAQREELQLTREELRGQKEELEAQRKEFRTQNITLKRQRFESMFFNMLATHSNIVKEIRYKNIIIDMQNSYSGVGALNACLVDYNNKIMGQNNYGAHRVIHRQIFTNIYDSVSPYFQSLIALHTAIIDAKFRRGAKERYCKMLAAYISSSERRFLFYYLATAEEGTITNGLLKMEKDLDILKTFPTAGLL